MGLGTGVAAHRGGSAVFSPLVLSPAIWLRADNLSAGLVSTWTDQSGNGNSCTAAGGVRPTCVDAVFNGKPIVRYAGGQRMQGTAALTTTALSAWFVATLVNAGGGQDAFFDLEPGTSTNSGYLAFNDGGTFRWRALDGSSGTLDATFSMTLATPTLVVMTKTGTTLKLYQNGVLRDTETSAPVAPDSTANYRVGQLFQDALPATCDIAEFGVVSGRVISDAEIASLTDYSLRYVA